MIEYEEDEPPYRYTKWSLVGDLVFMVILPWFAALVGLIMVFWMGLTKGGKEFIELLSKCF